MNELKSPNANQLSKLGVFLIISIAFTAAQSARGDVDKVEHVSTSFGPAWGTDKPNMDKADFAVVSRAMSLSAYTEEVGVSLRSANGVEGQGDEAQIKAQVGVGKGVDLFVLANRGVKGPNWKPGAGAQWQFYGKNSRPLTMAIATQFRKGAFAEPNGEGEVDLEWIGTYRVRRSEISANILGGSDLDGETHVFEARFAGVRSLTASLKGGLEAESRWSLRSSPDDAGDESDGQTSKMQLGDIRTTFIGPMIQYGVTSLTLTAAVGFSTYDQSAPGPDVSNSGVQGIVKANYGF